YTGGLKRIEKELGLGDRTGVEGIEGIDAVRLWEDARRGVPGSLEKLVNYNRADAVNLEPLLEFAVREMSARLLPLTPMPSA
ncbi:MAG: ribonuclease H-like domain-containing protein, partial [Thermoplasmata archaeon]|nr:ribonuclease H-like domain-containing protein [Thermoplasmata archaeon]